MSRQQSRLDYNLTGGARRDSRLPPPLRGNYPYADAQAIRRAQEVERDLRRSPYTTSYIWEKAGAVAGDFGYWFTERRWRQYDDDPQHLRGNVHTSIGKLRNAINTEWRDNPRF